MNFSVTLPSGKNPHSMLQQCGYALNRDPNNDAINYVRRLGSYFYPRFHVYVQKVENGVLHLSLHLDMKKPTYIKGRAHSGEYDGDQVEQEMFRIKAMARLR